MKINPDPYISFLGKSEINNNLAKAAAIGTGAVIETVGTSSITSVAATAVSTVLILWLLLL